MSEGCRSRTVTEPSPLSLTFAGTRATPRRWAEAKRPGLVTVVGRARPGQQRLAADGVLQVESGEQWSTQRWSSYSCWG